MTQSVKPKTMPWISPRLVVKDIEEAILFYDNAFGFKKDYEIEDEIGELVYAALRYKESIVLLTRQGARSGIAQVPLESGVEAPITLFVYVDNVDTFFEHAIKNGAAEICRPEDTSWGNRICCLGDPQGYLWTFTALLQRS